jgi:16S rRNA G966 N2-methylase RsmD
VTIHLRSDATALVSVDGFSAGFPISVLALLDTFRSPTSVSHALERIGSASHGAAEWIALTGALQRLVEMGALREPDAVAPKRAPSARAHAFEKPSEQIRMLDDRARTEGFLGAIREVVRPTDVVVDIGTGTGVLAIAAAQAGARHVYAIEATAMADMAQRLVDANGLSDRVTVVRGWSTNVELPERATVLVSEIIGADPFDEDVLSVMRDATRRLVTADARMVPSRLALSAALVEVPEDVWIAETYTSGAAERWKAAYAIDFGELVRMGMLTRFFAPRRKARGWKRVSEPVRLGHVDFAQTPATIDWTATPTALEGSTRTGVLTFFELTLGSSVFAQDPLVDDASHWRCPVWVTSGASTVEKGGRYKIRYRRGGESALSLAAE